LNNEEKHAASRSAVILIVEDEPGILNLLVSLLSEWDYSTLSARSLDQAHKIWNSHSANVDLLLTDLSLGDGSASEFIVDVLNEKPDLKVLVMTGHSREVLDFSGDLNQRIVLVEKPFAVTELKKIIRAAAPPSLEIRKYEDLP